MAKKKNFSLLLTVFLCILSMVVGACVGFVGAHLYDRQNNPIYKSDVVYGGDISFHFMELGNNYTGDCVLIKCGDTEILVDGGSRTNSVDDIKSYVDEFVTDGVIEFGIITHADRDHIACFAGDNTNDSLFEIYEFETIIDFPRTNKDTATYQTYVAERTKEVQAGATHYTALQCYNETDGAKRSYEIGTNTTLNILYNYYYENHSSDENNYSVCFQIEEGDNKYLFTGDLEKEGEEELVKHNTLSKVKLYKAGHHGSRTSSNDCLLDIIQPEICVACCCCGSVEYTNNLENTFPTQEFIDRISKWTTQVYVPTVGEIVQSGVDEIGDPEYEDVGFSSMNGDIVVKSTKGVVTVECSNNNTLLKDTVWFSEYRTRPTGW